MSFSELKAQRSLYDKIISILVQSAREDYENQRKMATGVFGEIFALLGMHTNLDKHTPVELFFALNRIKRKTIIARLSGKEDIMIDNVAKVDLAYSYVRTARKTLPVKESEEVMVFEG